MAAVGGARKKAAANEPSADVEALRALEDWLIDHRWPDAYDLSHSILSSDWLAAHTAAAEARGAERALLTLADEIATGGYGWTGVKDAERFKARLRDRAAREAARNAGTS